MRFPLFYTVQTHRWVLNPNRVGVPAREDQPTRAKDLSPERIGTAGSRLILFADLRR